MEFTIVDAGAGIITLVSALLASSRGLTREIFALAGWIVAAVAGFYVAPALEPLIREVPVVGPFLARSCVLSVAAAFTIIVAIVLLVLSVFTPMISNLVLDSAFGGMDRFLGFLFGLARGVVLLAIGFLLYTNLSGGESWPPLDTAASLSVFQDGATMIQQNLPESVPEWFGARVDALMVNCAEPGNGADISATPSLPADSGAGTDTGAASGTGATTGTGN